MAFNSIPDSKPVEFVERKGVGHPDTIADALANAFSRHYSDFCMTNFGGVPRHSVDKLVLSGATSDLTFGEGVATSPVRCHLVGKLTDDFSGTPIPVHELVRSAYSEISKLVYCEATVGSLPPLEVELNTNSGIGAEHFKHYYRPTDLEHLDDAFGKYEANDSAMVFGHATPSRLEKLIWSIENSLSSKTMQSKHGSGTDVKVLGSRAGRDLRIQVAVPLVAALVKSESAYLEIIDIIKQQVNDLVDASPLCGLRRTLNVNTKDRPGFGYLTLAGSSLDKGDQGAVGRGNNYSGVISMLRPQSMESHSGKNPYRSAGRIYPAICADISLRVMQEEGIETTVAIQSANGRPLHEPELMLVLDPQDRALNIVRYSLDEGSIVKARCEVLDHSQLHADVYGRVGSSVSSSSRPLV